MLDITLTVMPLSLSTGKLSRICLFFLLASTDPVHNKCETRVDTMTFFQQASHTQSPGYLSSGGCVRA